MPSQQSTSSTINPPSQVMDAIHHSKQSSPNEPSISSQSNIAKKATPCSARLDSRAIGPISPSIPCPIQTINVTHHSSTAEKSRKYGSIRRQMIRSIHPSPTSTVPSLFPTSLYRRSAENMSEKKKTRLTYVLDSTRHYPASAEKKGEKKGINCAESSRRR